MSFSGTIGKYDLQPGQWIIFHWKSHKIGPFQVLGKDDNYFVEPCRYAFITKNGSLLTYFPRMNRLESTDLFNYDVKVIASPAGVSPRKLRDLQQRAIEHIKMLSKEEYKGYLFDPSDQTTSTAEQIRKKYNLTIKEQAKK